MAGWCDDVILFWPLCRCTRPSLCPNIPPVSAGLAVQRPLHTFTPWAVLVCGLCGLSGGPSYSWRSPLHHPLPSFQPLAEMLASQEQCHLALKCLIMHTVFLMSCLRESGEVVFFFFSWELWHCWLLEVIGLNKCLKRRQRYISYASRTFIFSVFSRK